MPKRHVGSFFYVLTSNPADFSYHSSHYTTYLFCITQCGINNEESVCKTKTSYIIDCRERENIKENLKTMYLWKSFVKLAPLAIGH